jgi:hypothetical protein
MISRAFFIGFFGSAGLEVVKLARSLDHDGRIMKPFSTWTYWLVRVLLAAVGGGLAHIYDLNAPISPILALHIGAAAPAIFDSVSQKPPEA